MLSASLLRRPIDVVAAEDGDVVAAVAGFVAGLCYL